MSLSDKTYRLLLSALGSPEARDELLNDIETIESSEIATGAVTEAKLASNAVSSGKISNTAGAVKVHRFDVSYADLNTAGTGVAVLLGTEIPDNAICTRAYYEVTQTFVDSGTAGDADSSTIQMGLDDQSQDVLVSTAISAVGDAFDAGFHATILDGNITTFLKLTGNRQLAVTWTAGTGNATALTAGSMNIFVEYVQGV